jgi:uncharacterized protein (DUF924 family)
MCSSAYSTPQAAGNKSLKRFKDNPKEKHYAEMHLRIIERFGRFPHRNNALGRKSTEEELQFLTTPNSSF